MTDLIERLEAAAEGSRELDGEVALLIGWEKRHKGFAHWISPDGAGNQLVPFFTTSIDAKLPGENIVKIKRFSLGDGEGEFLGHAWIVTHEDQETNENYTGEGHTEPLARRIAALKALEPSE